MRHSHAQRVKFSRIVTQQIGQYCALALFRAENRLASSLLIALPKEEPTFDENKISGYYFGVRTLLCGCFWLRLHMATDEPVVNLRRQRHVRRWKNHLRGNFHRASEYFSRFRQHLVYFHEQSALGIRLSWTDWSLSRRLKNIRRPIVKYHPAHFNFFVDRPRNQLDTDRLPKHDHGNELLCYLLSRWR